MYDLSQKGLTHQQVLDSLIQAHKRDAVDYRLDIVRNGIAIVRPKYSEAQIECDSSAEVKYIGRFRIQEDSRINWETDYIRPVMSFAGLEVPMVPLKPVTDPREVEPGITWHNIEAYDQSVQIQENSLGEILFIPKGTLYTAAVIGLLEKHGFTDTNIDPSPLTLQTDREDWDEADYILSVANQLLEEINYTTLSIGREGIFHAKRYIEPSITNASIQYNAADGLVVAQKSIETDSYKRPNRFIGQAMNPDMEEPLRFEYVITDPSIPISTTRQGYVRTIRLDFNNVADAETLEELVIRYAMETARSYENAVMTTAIMPQHEVLDVVSVNALGLLGVYEETGWSIDHWGKTGRMTHRLRRLVYD